MAKMNMFDPGEFGRSTGKWIHRHNIFRIVISDEGKIAELTIDSFLVVKMISRLNIDFILTLTGYEINFSFLQYPDLYIKSFTTARTMNSSSSFMPSV